MQHSVSAIEVRHGEVGGKYLVDARPDECVVSKVSANVGRYYFAIYAISGYEILVLSIRRRRRGLGCAS